MSSPDLGSTSTRRLGDTLLSKAIATFGPAYQIEKGARVGKARTDELNNRMALVGQQEDYLYDQTREDFVTTKWPDEDLLCAGMWNVCKDTNTGKFVLAFFNQYELLFVRDIEEGKVKETEKVEVNPTNFKQELIYNGRVGDGLKFIYREFSGDLARPSFTQSIQYDLSKSNLIGFKDAELEIIEATNTEISYTVRSNF
jgi:hypothetical protein|tara:strand:+ start:304 stop:900 length:597 start_codon:yes stop_codon:yes gene_type:complete